MHEKVLLIHKDHAGQSDTVHMRTMHDEVTYRIVAILKMVPYC